MREIINKSSLALIFFLFLITLHMPNVLANDIEWRVMPELNNVPTNKEFTITFSEHLAVGGVRTENIYVENEQGQRVDDVDVFTIDNSNIVKVLPPNNGYAANETFTLFINEKVYSVAQETLASPTKMTFTTTNTADTSGDFVEREDSKNAIEFTDNTELLSVTVLNTLVAGDYAGNMFTFENPNAHLQSLAVGNIMILPPTAEYPNGWSKKIERIERNGRQLTFTTSEPTIEEVITDMDISQIIDITSDDLQLSEHLTKNLLSEEYLEDGSRQYLISNSDNSAGTITFSGGDNPKITFSDLEVHKNAAGEELILGGSLGLTKPKFHIDTKWFALNRLEFTAGMSNSLTLDLKKSADFLEKRIPLGVEIPIKAYGVAGAAVQFFFIIEANGEIAVGYEIKNSVKVNVGVKKEDGDWKPINKSKVTSETEIYAFKGSLTGKVGILVNVKAEVLQFTLGGVDVSVNYKPTLEGEISTSKYCLKLTHSISLDGEARIGDVGSNFTLEYSPFSKHLGTLSNCNIRELLVDSVSLQPGEDKQLIVKGVDGGSRLQQFDLPDDSITFESEDTSIAIVNIFGVVAAKANAPAGSSTYIKVTHTSDEGREVTKRVRVRISADDQNAVPTSVNGTVTDSATNAGLAGVSVEVYNQNSELLQTLTTNATGKYTTELLPNVYQFKFIKDGFKTTTSYVDVHENSDQSTLTVNTIQLLRNDVIELGDVSGLIIDSVTGASISDASIFFRQGNNVTTGDYDYATETDNYGQYTAQLEAGTYTLEILKEEYVKGYFNVTVLPNQLVDNQNFTISKVLNASDLRVVLTWGNSPNDLDLHTWGPSNENSIFHMYYSNINDRYMEEFSGVSLDRDDTNRYGPETLTINEMRDGIYTFGIHNYSNRSSSSSIALSNSNAQVNVYLGDSLMPVRTFHVPTNQEGIYWEVFKFNGATNEIIPVNELSNEMRYLFDLSEKTTSEQ